MIDLATTLNSVRRDTGTLDFYLLFRCSPFTLVKEAYLLILVQVIGLSRSFHEDFLIVRNAHLTLNIMVIS